MSETMFLGAESVSSMNNVLSVIADSLDQLSQLFDRSIDSVADFARRVGAGIKKLWMQLLGFIDKELFQIRYIKNHLRDIQSAVDRNDPAIVKHGQQIVGSLIEMWDMIKMRLTSDNAYMQNLWFAVLEIKPMIDGIVEKVGIDGK